MKKVKCILLILFVMIITSCHKNEKKNGPNEEVTISATPTSVASITGTVTITEIATVTPEVEVNSTAIYTNEDGSLGFPVQSIDETKEYEAPFMTKDEFPIIDGSTANIPLGEAIYCYLTKATKEDAVQDLHFYTTPDSYRRLINNEADLLFVYEPSQVVLQEMMNANAQLEFKPLGRDALVFIENDTNPVTSLTQQQITDIYTGKTTNWASVGGEDLEILPFQRPETSGSQTLMEKLAVPKEQLMQGPQVSRPMAMDDLIDVLASYNNESNALGYSVFFYANYMYNKPGLRFVAIDNIIPTNETIQTGEYPYVNDFYVVIRASESKDSKARQIYNWMTTKEAQTMVQSTGYVPIIAVGSEEITNQMPEIKGSLKLKDDQYIIVQNKNQEETFLGDSIYDKNFKEIVTFPGKTIVCNYNMTCYKDDILILNAYEKVQDGDEERTEIHFELYSLDQMKYITTSMFDSIKKINDLYFYHNYSREQGEYFEACYNSNGSLICSVPNNTYKDENLSVVKNNVAHIREDQVIFYDTMGNEIKKITFSEFPIGCTVDINYYQLKNNYLSLLNMDTNTLLLYDANGNEITSSRFLPKNKQSKITKPWINQVVLGTDGHLYVAGIIDNHIVIAKDDQTIIWSQDINKNAYDVTLTANLFILRSDWEKGMIITLDGTLLNPDEKITQMNETIIIQKENGFDVIATEKDTQYFVADENYVRDAFYSSEGVTYPELTTYYEEGENPYSSYLGKRTFAGYASFRAINDTYSIIFTNQLIDPDQYIYESKDYIFDRNGKIYYEGKVDESITGAIVGEELYVIAERGNYMEISDMDGNVMYRQYSNRLSDD